MALVPLLMLSPRGRRNLLETMDCADGSSLGNASGKGNIHAGSALSICVELTMRRMAEKMGFLSLC